MGFLQAFSAGANAFDSGQRIAIARQAQALSETREADEEKNRSFLRGKIAQEQIDKANDLAQKLDYSNRVKTDYDQFREARLAERVNKDPDNMVTSDELRDIERWSMSRAREKNIVNLPASMAEKAFTSLDQLETREELARGRDDVRRYIANQNNQTRESVANLNNQTRESIAALNDERLRDKVERDNETRQAAAELRWSNKAQGWSAKQRDLFRGHKALIEKNTEMSPAEKRFALDQAAERIDAGGGGAGEPTTGDVSDPVKGRLDAIDRALSKLKIFEARGDDEVDTKDTGSGEITINEDTASVWGEDIKEVRRRYESERLKLRGEWPTGDKDKDKQKGIETTSKGNNYKERSVVR